MEWIKNQPVFFGEPDECSDDEIYPVQLVDNTDTTQVQFKLSPCASAVQLLENWTYGGWNTNGWELTVVDGQSELLLCANGAMTTGAFTDFQFTESVLYQITIEVPSFSSGGFDVYLGAAFLGKVTSSGTFTFTGFADPEVGYYAGTSLILYPLTVETTLCISQIYAYEINTDIKIAIYNSAGVYQNELSYADDILPFEFAKDTVTVSIDWSDLGISNGCYYLCLLDPCEQNLLPEIDNCTFTGSSTGWNLTGNASYLSGTILLDGGGAGELTQANVFDVLNTSSYCVTITVIAVTGTLNVYFGATLVGTITDTDVSGVYIHTFTGIPDAANLTLSVESGNIANIDSVCPCEITPADYVCNLQSNTFKLADYTNDCTLIINACNNEDGLGFVFENSGFSPRIRLEAKLRQAKYPSERTIYDDSKGSRKVVYFSGRKAKNLCIDLQPEYVHDFLRLLLGFDNVYINNDAFTIDDDEYNVEYDESSDELGKVKLLVSKKDQDIKNINGTDVQNVCNLPPNYLLQADDLSQNVTLTNGELILING